MRCVFDTNVLICALLVSDSEPRRALDLALSRGRVLLSDATLTELSQVLGRKQFQRYLGDEDVRAFLAALVRETQWIQVNVKISTCRDAKDNKFLELGVSGNATHIITGDADLLVLDPFENVRVVAPADFMRFHSGEPRDP